MDNSLKGKRLLVLGGTALSNNIVETAHSMGVYVIVMDMNPDSPAKKIADEAYDVSTADVNDVIKVLKECKADGIFTSYEDFNTGIVAEVCEKVGLPFYASLEQIDLTRNKLSFKEICRKHNITTVDEYHLDENFSECDLEKIVYPVIIKPADSYAARGIYICNNKHELIEAFPKSIAFSRVKRVIVERFMTGDYLSITFSIMNGHLNLSAMNDKAINVEQKGIVPLPAAYIYPSKYINLCYQQIVPALQEMVTDLKLRDSTFSIEAIVHNNKIYVFEMSYRIGGVNDWKFVQLENGTNHMEMYIRLALGQSFTGYDLNSLENPRFKNCYCLLNVLAETGKIAKIEGVEEIKNNPHVFRYSQNYTVGDEITWPGTLRQIFSKVFIKADSKKEILQQIQSVINTLKVIDDSGKNLIMFNSTWHDLCQ